MSEVFTRQATISQGTADLTTAPVGLNVHTLTINVSVAADARSGPYYPGPGCKSVMAATTGVCKFQVRGGGFSGLPTTEYRDCILAGGGQQTATATKVGVLAGPTMPHEFYLFDTSGSTNRVSLSFIYE